MRCYDESTLSSESKHEETQPSQNASLSPLWEQQMHLLIDQADLVKGIFDMRYVTGINYIYGYMYCSVLFPHGGVEE